MIGSPFYLKDWGMSGDVNNLELKWHIPTEEERLAVADLLEQFLLPELTNVDRHTAQLSTLDR